MSLTKEIINKMKKSPLVWDTISTTFFSTLGKAFGFLIPFFIAAWFGVSSKTDAFFLSYGIILFLASLFAPVVESVVVPYIAEARAKREDVGKFIGSILTISLLGLIGLAFLFLLIAKPLLSLTTRFEPSTFNLAYSLLKETTPLLILLVLTGILAGTLNAYKKFALPAFSPALRAGVILIIIFVLRGIWGVHSIAIGYVLGEAFRFFILLLTIFKFNLFTLRFFLNLDRKIKNFLKTASYQTAGMLAVGLNPLVDKIMASWLGKGAVSILHYGDRLYMIPITFISSGLMVTLLSHWSSHYYRSGRERLDEDVKKTLKLIVPLTLGITALLLLFHKPLVKLLFGHGAFTEENISAVATVWVYYLLGIAPYTGSQMYVRAHIVLKNTKTLLKCALYLNVLNISLNYILMKPLGISGIALATTLTSLFSFLYFSNSFRKFMKAAGGV